jgi:hypothetical protein
VFPEPDFYQILWPLKSCGGGVEMALVRHQKADEKCIKVIFLNSFSLEISIEDQLAIKPSPVLSVEGEGEGTSVENKLTCSRETQINLLVSTLAFL